MENKSFLVEGGKFIVILVEKPAGNIHMEDLKLDGKA
jgi:hypothetical protein